jgi:hypothetical protein
VGETVTVSGSGTMTGWYIISTNGSQRFDFPAGYVLGGSVVIRSNVAAFPPSPTQLWWTTAAVWNNTQNDDAQLFNCQGMLVQTFDDGQ